MSGRPSTDKARWDLIISGESFEDAAGNRIDLAKVVSPWTAVKTSEPFDLRYPGGKGLAGLQQWICAQLPPHVYYVESFAGKAGVFRAKTPALHSTLIDRDAETCAWLRKHIGRYDVRSLIAGADEFGRPRRGQRGGPQHISIVQGCGIEHLERMADSEESDPETLVYLDPPYHLSTRSKLKLYRYELSDRDHRRLLRCVVRLRCSVVISGYMCDLYADRLSGWSLKTRQVITRGRTLATECLWSNSAAAQASAFGLTYDQLGSDFRERERVSRLVKRRTDEFRSRPAHVRRALLLSLLNAEAQLGTEAK